MPIPDTCINDNQLYVALTGKGGLVTPMPLLLRRGAATVEAYARPWDLPYGAFGQLVRDEIDPLWGARDLAPDEFDDLVDLINDRDPGGVERPLHIFDPEDINVRKVRCLYDSRAKLNGGPPSIADVLDAMWLELEGTGTFFADMKEREAAEAEEAETEDAESVPAPAETAPEVAAPPVTTPTTPPHSAVPAQPIPAPQPAANPQPKGNTPMQLTVDKGPLLAALKRAVSVAGKKTTMPIIECVLLDVAGSILTLSATDLAVDMQIKVPVAMDARPGRLAVPGAALVTAIDALPDGAQATLEKTDDARLRIMASRTRFHVPTMHPDDFPAFAMVDGSEVRVQAQELKRAIDRVAFGISTDDVARPQLAGMFLHARPEGLRVVGANGQILSRSDLVTTAPATEFVQAFSEPGRPQGVMIPRDSVTALRRLLDAVDGETEVTAIIGRKRAIFEMFPLRFGTTLSAAEYIAYEAVLSQTLATAKRNWTVPRAGLLATVRRVRALAGDKGRTVALTVTGDGVRAETTVRESATDAVDILEAPTGLCDAPIDIGFAAGHLAAALDSLNAGTVTCTMTDHLLPTFWRAEQEGDILAAEHLVVVMPFRLDPKKAEA